MVIIIDSVSDKSLWYSGLIGMQFEVIENSDLIGYEYRTLDYVLNGTAYGYFKKNDIKFKTDDNK